ncbi:MAG: hypothetical protein K0R38_5928 [Polyangiaceae bacterium]|nr:hypothetical protein [Polyangiaceae bacterium]
MHKSPHVLVAIAKTYARAGLPAALGVALMIGCADNQDKRVPRLGEGGEAGAAGEASSVDAGGSSYAGTGGAGGAAEPAEGEAGSGATSAGAGAAGAAGAAAMGGAPGSNTEPGGAANGGDGAGTQAGAGPGGAAGTDNEPTIPVSVCGPGKWYAGEGLCAECPAAPQEVELGCADYASAQVLTTTAGQLQYAFASLPTGVQAHEASPVELSVTYLGPNESHVRQSPEPPESIIVPPFSTADVCGAVFHSTEPVRFDRAAGQAVSYTKFCP